MTIEEKIAEVKKAINAIVELLAGASNTDVIEYCEMRDGLTGILKTLYRYLDFYKARLYDAKLSS